MFFLSTAKTPMSPHFLSISIFPRSDISVGHPFPAFNSNCFVNPVELFDEMARVIVYYQSLQFFYCTFTKVQ